MIKSKLLVLLGGITISFVMGCDFTGDFLCEDKEKYRQTSPDGVVDVVVNERDCGATTSVAVSVYIVSKGELVEEYHPVFVSDKTSGLEVKWIKPKNLVINYDKARIFKFQNFWHSKNVENFMYKVTIREYQKSEYERLQNKKDK